MITKFYPRVKSSSAPNASKHSRTARNGPFSAKTLPNNHHHPRPDLIGAGNDQCQQFRSQAPAHFYSPGRHGGEVGTIDVAFEFPLHPTFWF